VTFFVKCNNDGTIFVGRAGFFPPLPLLFLPPFPLLISPFNLYPLEVGAYSPFPSFPPSLSYPPLSYCISSPKRKGKERREYSEGRGP